MVRSATEGTRAAVGRQPFPPFRFEQECAAHPDVVYGLLADLTAHLEWAGRRQSSGFRLLSMEAPTGPAGVGTEFHSTGTDGKKRLNRDRSVVTEAVPGSVFEFVTENRCEGTGGMKAAAGTFVHRYEIDRTEAGSRLSYTLETTRYEGGPAILRFRPIRPLLMKALGSMFRKGFENLVALAEERARTA